MKNDKLFSKPLKQIADFSFDRQVAQVFSDMIGRSIPGFDIVIHNIGRLSARYAQPDSNLYDLGCATGISTLSMAKQVNCHGTKIIGVDISSEMLSQCETFINNYQHQTPIELIEADIHQLALAPCSVVVLNFTLQFLPPDKRASMLKRIYDALLPGGLLILSEKIKHDDIETDDVLIELHHQFKRDNGYSDLEISQKRTALENVMKLDTLKIHQSRIENCGFIKFSQWYQCFNFTSMLAFKPS